MFASTLAFADFVAAQTVEQCNEAGYTNPDERAGRVLLTAALRTLYDAGVAIHDIQDAVVLQWNGLLHVDEAMSELSQVVAEPFSIPEFADPQS